MYIRHNGPWWVTVTYLIYIILWEGMIFLGTGYAVLYLNRDPWWFLFALVVSTMAYSPHKWHALWNADVAIELTRKIND